MDYMVEIRYPPELKTADEQQAYLNAEIQKINRNGGIIVSAEPINEFVVQVVGRRFGVKRVQ